MADEVVHSMKYTCQVQKSEGAERLISGLVAVGAKKQQRSRRKGGFNGGGPGGKSGRLSWRSSTCFHGPQARAEMFWPMLGTRHELA